MHLPQPITFCRYGIELKEVGPQDLELVRQWRNDPKISSLMLDQTYISEQRQRAWFEKISASDRDYYFVARFKGQAIGVAALTAIDKENASCEPTLYIYVDEYRNNIIPFCVAFALNDMAFEQFALQKLYGKIFIDNTASARFHETCGYRKYGQDGDRLELYLLTPDTYVPARDKIVRFIRY